MNRIRLVGATLATVAAFLATRTPAATISDWGAVALACLVLVGAALQAPGWQPAWGRRTATLATIGLLAWPRVATPLLPVPAAVVVIASLLFLHELHAPPGHLAPRVGEGGKDALARVVRATGLLALLALPLLFVALADTLLPATAARTHELRHGGGGLLLGAALFGAFVMVGSARRALRGALHPEAPA